MSAHNMLTKKCLWCAHKHLCVCKKTGHVNAWPGGCACQPQAACVKGKTYESKTPADVCGVAVAPLIVGLPVCGGLHGWRVICCLRNG